MVFEGFIAVLIFIHFLVLAFESPRKREFGGHPFVGLAAQGFLKPIEEMGPYAPFQELLL